MIVDPKRERDNVKQEYFGSRSGGSYVLGRSQNISSNVLRIYPYINEHELSVMEDPDYDSHISMVRGSS